MALLGSDPAGDFRFDVDPIALTVVSDHRVLDVEPDQPGPESGKHDHQAPRSAHRSASQNQFEKVEDEETLGKSD